MKLFKLFNAKNQGSALIITMLLVMVVSAIGLGSARLTLSEVNQSRKLEDSTGAYYAAYSGIEHGLLLFRFNHNIQLSNLCQDPSNCHEIPTALTGAPAPFTYNNDPDARYELKIYHKNGTNTETVNTVGDTPALGQDQVVEYSLVDPSEEIGENCDSAFKTCPMNGPFFLKWSYTNTNPTLTQQDQMRLEYVAYDDNHEVIAGKGLFKYSDFLALTASGYNLTNAPSGGYGTMSNATRIRIMSYGGDLSSYSISTGANGELMDSRYTTIESTGYYGSTKRKLQVQVDRQTGTLLRTFDFVLYSGMGDINPGQ